MWGNDHEITAVELRLEIATIYQDFFPNDHVVVGDAHQYLLDHYREYEDLSLDSVVTKEDAIKMYRAITGACEAGTKHFVGGLKKLKPRYTIAEIIELTEGQFGATDFKNFFAEDGNE